VKDQEPFTATQAQKQTDDFWQALRQVRIEMDKQPVQQHGRMMRDAERQRFIGGDCEAS